MNELEKFYKSKKWESFRALLISQRMQADGSVICAMCGKPILKKYDMIAHHKQELTLDNVGDVSVSLNPENIDIIHFRCHNEAHKRFGYQEKPTKKVYIVYGAPLSGKTTFVQENATEKDIIIDIDRIYTAVSIAPLYCKPAEVKGVVFKIKELLLELVKTRYGKWENAYIIGGLPLESERERLVQEIGADDVVFIDTPKEVCEARLQAMSNGRNKKEWQRYIDDWFERWTDSPL